MGNGRGRPAGTETDRQRQKGRQTRARRPPGIGREKATVGGEHAGSPMGEGVPIRFGTYNIRNGRKGGLDSALQGMSQANMDLGIFQETKCTDGIYTRESAGYSVVATDAPSRHRGGLDVLYRPSPHFAVEAMRQFGPNVVGFQLATGARRWYIIGCYLAPDDTLKI